MDWTGGIRRRFAPKGTGNAILQKQKAHFARCRNKRGVPSSQSKQDARHIALAAELGINRLRDRSHSEEPAPGLELPLDSEQQRRTPTPAVKHAVDSSNQDRAGKFGHGRRRQSRDAQQGMPLEEGHSGDKLISQRQQLLSRADWLGLAFTRPEHTRFPSSQDKGRIGKRRKMTTSVADRGRARKRRALTPLFNEAFPLRPESPDVRQSLDEIQIKIGPGALASQTQASRWSRQTSLVSLQSSASAGGCSLSEESMLLGENGEPFETVIEQTSSRHFDRAVGLLEGDIRDPIEQSGDHTRALSLNSPVLGQSRRIDVPRTQISARTPQGEIHPGALNATTSDENITMTGRLHSSESSQDAGSMNQPGSDSYESTSKTATNFLLAATPLPGINTGEDDDIWPSWLGMEQYRSDNTSLSVQKSSIIPESMPSEYSMPLRYTDSSGDERFPLTHTSSDLKHMQDFTDASLKSIVETPTCNLGAQPNSSCGTTESELQCTEAREDDSCQVDEDEDLWRRFIVSSHNGQDEPAGVDEGNTQLEGKPCGLEPDDTFLHDSDFSVSGLGTSDKATAGYNALVRKEYAQSLFSRPESRHELTNHEFPMPEDQTDVVSDSDAFEHRLSRRFEASRASSIPDQDYRSTHRGPFKQPVFEPRRLPQRANRFLPANRNGRPEASYSVFDLIDSDGQSLE